MFVRKEASTLKIVGIERDWPGKRIAGTSDRSDKIHSRYPDLEEDRKKLFDDLYEPVQQADRILDDPRRLTLTRSVSLSGPPSTRSLTR